MDADDITHRFTYHRPDGDKAARHEQVREQMLVTAHRIDELCTTGRELFLAMTALEEAMMWANASIAREQPDDLTPDHRATTLRPRVAPAGRTDSARW
jgi:hypothetical protein